MNSEIARSEDVAPAFELLFQHCPEEQRQTRCANAVELTRQGLLDIEGIRVMRNRDGELVGAVACTPLAGAGGLIWPPQVIEHPHKREVEDQLTREATTWLRQRGAKLAQALLTSEEVPLGDSLLRNGFRNITKLWYMRHDLEIPPQLLGQAQQLTYQSFADCDQQMFRETLLRSYENTLDCPEVNGVRTIDEAIEGHKQQGVHDPGLWLLALHGEQPVGVLIMTAMPDVGGWDLAYLGVVEEARGQGMGRELTLKALLEAKLAGIQHLTLSVDARNRAAWNLYRGAGFEPYDQRHVFLIIW